MALAPTESMKLADVQSRMMEWTVHRGSIKTASSRSDSLCRSSSWPFLCSSATLLWDKTSWVTPCSLYWNQPKRRILHEGNSNKPQGISCCHFCVFLDPAADSRTQISRHSTHIHVKACLVNHSLSVPLRWKNITHKTSRGFRHSLLLYVSLRNKFSSPSRIYTSPYVTHIQQHAAYLHRQQS